jgi:hypothetical protein
MSKKSKRKPAGKNGAKQNNGKPLATSLNTQEQTPIQKQTPKKQPKPPAPENVIAVPFKVKPFYLALSFLLPIIIFGVVFIFIGIYPFGTRQIMISDFREQYLPFLSDLWRKLRGGNSLLWSWSTGGGSDYLGMISYYLASPLNLLTALFPFSVLREVLTVIVLLKIGIAGLSCGFF